MAITYCPGTEILMHIAKKVLPGHKLVPDIQQHGGWEIHPALKDLTFNFWIDPENSPICWVNQDPATWVSETPSWACQLTGFKATDGFGEAKGYLREMAAQLAEKAGFVYKPAEHGYRWL